MFTNSYPVDNIIEPQITALHVNDKVHLVVTLSQFCPTLLSIFVLNDFVNGLYTEIDLRAAKITVRIKWRQCRYRIMLENAQLKNENNFIQTLAWTTQTSYRTQNSLEIRNLKNKTKIFEGKIQTKSRFYKISCILL